MSALAERVTRRMILAAAAAVIAIVAVASTLVITLSGPGTYTITARFVATPGLYHDNAVTILGVPTGHVTSVTPHDTYVDVVMSIPKNVKLPAGARAVLMAPNPVSDRFVELTPSYTGGAVMRRGAIIPLTQTVVPLELDQVFASVDDLSKTLGPAGANKDGELSAALHAFAQLADGNGADVHDAINSIAAALPALTQHPDDLTKLVNGLDKLTTTLASRDKTLNDLYGDLATATSQLSDERTTIAAAVTNLQQGLSQVADFIRTNQAHIGSSVRNLSTTVAAVMSEQKALIQTFDTAPLGFQNFNRSIQDDADCISATGDPHNCAALFGRLDFTKDAATFLAKYCGNSILASFLPILESNAKLGNATARETACGAQIGALQNRVGPSGSPNSPDLDLTHYLGTR